MLHLSPSVSQSHSIFASKQEELKTIHLILILSRPGGGIFGGGTLKFGGGPLFIIGGGGRLEGGGTLN